MYITIHCYVAIVYSFTRIFAVNTIQMVNFLVSGLPPTSNKTIAIIGNVNVYIDITLYS